MSESYKIKTAINLLDKKIIKSQPKEKMSNSFLLKKFYLDQVNNSWRDFFQREEKNEYFFSLLEKIEEEYNRYKC